MKDEEEAGKTLWERTWSTKGEAFSLGVNVRRAPDWEKVDAWYDKWVWNNLWFWRLSYLYILVVLLAALLGGAA